jgi:hypothetical protein
MGATAGSSSSVIAKCASVAKRKTFEQVPFLKSAAMIKLDLRVALSIGMVLAIGCGEQRSNDDPPEAVYRRFMLALLNPKQSEIVELILNDPDAEILWQGSYPPAVAAALAEQYRTMAITRADGSNGKQVMLNSSAVPVPMKVALVDGKWKIDARPLIELRKAAKQIKEKE